MTALRVSVMEIEEMETSHWVRAVPVSMASKELSTTLSFGLHVLGQLAGDVHVEADDLAVLLEFERLVGDVGADGELAGIDELHAAAAGGSGSGAAAAASGEAEGPDGEDCGCLGAEFGRGTGLELHFFTFCCRGMRN